MALLIKSGLKCATTVLIESRSFGAVSITDISRSPSSDMCSVLGIGVALMVRTSTLCRSCFKRSLCRTPKRCSSSTISNPRSLNTTSFDKSRCVPISTSTFPAATSSRAAFTSFGLRNRLANSIRTGNEAKRLLNVS